MEFDQNFLFKTGIVCFTLVGFMGLGNLYISYPYMNALSIISSLSSISFNFALVLFFSYLYGQSRGSGGHIETIAKGEIDEIIKELDKNARKK